MDSFSILLIDSTFLLLIKRKKSLFNSSLAVKENLSILSFNNLLNSEQYFIVEVE